MSKASAAFRLEPYAVPKPWGGGHLDLLAHNTKPEKIGEYVLFSELPQFPVRVISGGQALLLADFFAQHGRSRDALPFMLKLLSTKDSLSLQNHPSDDDARALGLPGGGKFECWSILDADPSARAYLGLKQGEDAAVLRSLENESEPLRHFNEIHPQRGDVITLIPGLVHSTTGRLLFYEIQQTSDYTFRIYDFGRGRELHLDQAIFCLKDQTPQKQSMQTPLLTEKFQVHYHTYTAGKTIRTGSEDFSVLTWFGRPVELTLSGENFSLSWGDSLLVLGQHDCQFGEAQSLSAEAHPDLPMIDVLFEAFA
ncbi:MAG: class I mannose-6-phosphate isomerase [Leptospiraceae bacterium]|nr:class I mannose-6-phosphate isomerase [Leptospiraceae bacterium]